MTLQHGRSLIRQYLKTLTTPAPGIYQMIGVDGEVLYIGKAKILKNRIQSYTLPDRLPLRIQRMIAETKSLQFVLTKTEAEALVLENNLISKLKPKYNILLKYNTRTPYLTIDTADEFPRLSKDRSRPKHSFYKQFISFAAIEETTNILQKIFLLRTCTNYFFSTRSRPCLQYSIKRCSAPCVGRISKADYAILVQQAITFLNGTNTEIQKVLEDAMQAASKNLEFERAMLYRDKLHALIGIEQHKICESGVEDTDVIAIAQNENKTCVQLFIFRGGKHVGHKLYSLDYGSSEKTYDIMEACLSKIYAVYKPPPLLLLNVSCSNLNLISSALSQLAESKVTIEVPERGRKKDLVKYAETNAYSAIERYRSLSQNASIILEQLQKIFRITRPIKRIEVYDNSHTQGTNAYGAMVVGTESGFQKAEYRKFRFRQKIQQDDYKMMREMLCKRFESKGAGGSEVRIPDLIIIDGGLGHLNAATEALKQIQDTLQSHIPIIAMAKGKDRNAGNETFWLPDGSSMNLDKHRDVLHYLQRLRDEAHKTCINAHRLKNTKAMRSSQLEKIKGVGSKLQRAMLLHFGSLDTIKNATEEEILKIPGMSARVARNIVDHFSGVMHDAITK